MTGTVMPESGDGIGTVMPERKVVDLDPRIDQFVDERLRGLHDPSVRHIVHVPPGRYSWTGNDGYVYEQDFAVQAIEVTHIVAGRVRAHD